MGLGPIFKHHHRRALYDSDAATVAEADARCGYTLKFLHPYKYLNADYVPCEILNLEITL